MYQSIFAIALTTLITTCAWGQQQTASSMVSQEKLLAGRSGNQLKIRIGEKSKINIPRVCASLSAAYFEGHPNKSVTVHPRQNHWEIRFKSKPESPWIILEFDSPPKLPFEISAAVPKGDGTLTLECSQGITHGEKLLFEPQMHKNTIGYWAVQSDHVTWRLKIKQPGKYNVGLLQGCGNRGGGSCRISIGTGQGKQHTDEFKAIDSHLYTVKQTGHFQNFIWSHSGELTFPVAGEYLLRIQPTKIDDIALMDVRQVHLSPHRE